MCYSLQLLALWPGVWHLLQIRALFTGGTVVIAEEADGKGVELVEVSQIRD